MYVFLLRIASYPLSLSLNISFNSARRVSSICFPVVILSFRERGKEGEGKGWKGMLRWEGRGSGSGRGWKRWEEGRFRY